MKKTVSMGLILGFSISASLQAYADDSVNFLIEAPLQKRIISYYSSYTDSFLLTSNDGLLTKIGPTKLMFGPHTNVYKKDEKISSAAPQRQSGDVTLYDTDGWAGDFHVRCIIHWEHRFWVDSQGPHDRFKLSVVSEPEKMAYGGCAVDGEAHQSGQTVSIKP